MCFTFWADFVTSLDFVLFVHIKSKTAGAHSQPAVNTFKKYPVSPFFGSFYEYYKPMKILYDQWMPDMHGRIILLGKKADLLTAAHYFGVHGACKLIFTLLKQP